MKGHLYAHRDFSGKVEAGSVGVKCSDVTLPKLEDVSVKDQCCSFNGSHGRVLLTGPCLWNLGRSSAIPEGADCSGYRGVKEIDFVGWHSCNATGNSRYKKWTIYCCLL